MSGTAIAAKALNNDLQILGAEPLNADDACRSFKKGVLIPSVKPNTIADGLLTSLSTLTFKIITEKVDDILTAKEETIVEAMRLVWERMKMIIEPSSAVPLATIMENKDYFNGKKVGIIISGGNVDLNHLPF
jgi:threonine dehydratase